MALYFIPKYANKHASVSQEDLNALNDIGDLSEKMEKLRKLVELPAEDYETRQAVCTTLHDVMKQYYPDSVLLMYGSSVSGFGDKNCDVNLLFLPHPGYSNLEPVETENPTIPEPAKILSGETPSDVLSTLNEWTHLKFLRSVLRGHKTVAKNVSFVPSKSPCLKAIVNNKRVEVSVSNRFVVYNSELLNLLGSLDPRVKTLVIVLRFWATRMGFIRRSYFSRYAFTLLVVSFLQSTSPPVLPSVKRLMEIADYSRLIAGWETAFTANQNLVEKSKNTKSVGELLINFFDYYWNFDFVQNIISPYHGKPLPIKDVKSSKDNRMAEFEITCINIQDPFILSRNVCKADAPKAVYKLAILTASLILKDNNTFSTLFNSSEYQKTLDLHYGRHMIGTPKICFINLDYDSMTNLKKTTKTPHLWFEKVTQAVFDVLQYGLLLECEVTDKASWNKMATSAHRSNGTGTKPDHAVNGKEVAKSTPYDLELLLSVQCVLYTRTWIGRKNVTEFDLEEDEFAGLSGPVLKSEHAISRMLLKKNPNLDNPNPLMCLQCDCFKHSSPQISDIVVMLKPLTLSKEYYQVATFLASYIPKTVKKILSSD